MRALVCRELGTPDRLEFAELPNPVPGAGEVVIDVEAAGVNFPDGLIVAGKYQFKPELPFVPGSEVSGRVRELGPGVDGLEVSQRVAAFCGVGGYAERAVVEASQVHPLSGPIPATEAAALLVAYGTSYHALVDRADLVAGETLLVLGAAGGVGLAAVEIGHALGARVIAAASDAERLQLCAGRGADMGINYRDSDLGDAIDDATAGKGVDVVYDPVGGDAAQSAIRRLAWGGRFLTVGYASGDIPRVGLNRLLLNEGAALGVLWGPWARRQPEHNAKNIEQLIQWHQRGLVRPHIGGIWTLAEGAEALKSVMSRSALGKSVLEVPQ